ncbi:putative DedD protein [Pseudomonas aeruginosa 39016]|nr:putative DedD protein [Pseudomonas aeruginosa 39016]
MSSSPGCSSGTSVGCTSTLGMAGACGRGGASTTTWRDSSSRVNSIGRKITARAISTNAPTMRCFSPLSSKAMVYSPLSVLRASHSRPSATL